MKDLLIELLSLDFRLKIKKEFSQARITIVDNGTNLSASQYLPIDHHLDDENLKECIKYCMTKLIGKIKE